MNSHPIIPICRHTLRSEVLTAGSRDFWAMNLTAAALPAEATSRLRRARNPNVFYYVPLGPLFSQSCTVTPSQMPENTRGAGGRGSQLNLDSKTQPRSVQGELVH